MHYKDAVFLDRIPWTNHEAAGGPEAGNQQVTPRYHHRALLSRPQVVVIIIFSFFILCNFTKMLFEVTFWVVLAISAATNTSTIVYTFSLGQLEEFRYLLPLYKCTGERITSTG